MPHRWMSIIVLFLAIAFAVSPLIGGGFNGFEPSQFPVKDEWPAQPAGWAFSIWGPIYLALIVAAAVGLMRSGPNGDADWQRAAGPLAISLLVGVFWIEAANRAPFPATIMTVVMAGFAILAWSRRGLHLWQAIPLGLYAGWLTAASGVAISAAFTGYGIMPAQTAAVVMLVVVLAVALFVMTRPFAGWTYTPALIWALTGVIAANSAPFNLPVVAICAVGIVLLPIIAFRSGRA